ncbi:MAG: hypothetical protein LAT56_17900 [Wenzhouxiangella sp.]|nr:hypothetical protein [Wenzhouxiangella sp.]
MSATNDPIQEHLRETIRAAHYPDKPNRLLSSFVFETHDDAVFFRNNWRVGHNVYQVEFTNNPKSLHRVCYTAWDTTFGNQIFQAHSFWKNPALYSSHTEVFAEEDLVVL